MAGARCYLGQGILIATEQILTVLGASELNPSLATKCCVNAFRDYGSRNICLLAWWAGGSLSERRATNPVSCIPLAGQTAVGSAASFSVFSPNVGHLSQFMKCQL